MFEDDALINRYLLSDGSLTESQVSGAIDYSLDRNISYTEALVQLRLLTFEKLGACLSSIHNLPYYPLLQKPPTSFCKRLLTMKMVEKWKVFPVEFDPREDVLVIAIFSPDQIKSFVRIEQKMFAHHRLTFCIASEPEIEKAIEMYYCDEAGSDRGVALEIPNDFNIITYDESPVGGLTLQNAGFSDNRRILLVEFDADKGKAIQAILRSEGYPNVCWASSPREAARIAKKGSVGLLLINEKYYYREGDALASLTKGIDLPRIVFFRSIAPLVLGQELSYQAMSEALITFVGSLVRERLHGNVGRLRETADRVRYCQLLAMRLQLPPFSVDRTVLLAWLYDKDVFGAWLAGLSSLYRLKSVYDEIERPPLGTPCSESQILTVVLHLLAIKRTNVPLTDDVQRLRDELRRRCPQSIPESLIETTLNLLKDEAFISGIDRPAAHLLIADPALQPDSGFALRLSNDGYTVSTVGRARDALDLLGAGGIDCIISEVQLEDADGIQLCKTVKSQLPLASIPFVFVADAGEPRIMAECLRAGADDFLTKPVDLEVLSLKIHRLFIKKSGHDPRVGIKGSLSQMSVSDLIQMLSSNSKSVKITITSADSPGDMYMDQGEIVHACCGGAAGEAAFYRLMRFTEGDFEVVPCSSFSERTITLSVMALLLEGARIDDEDTRDAGESPVDG